MFGHDAPSAKLPSPDHRLGLRREELPDEALEIVGGGDHRELPVRLPESPVPEMKAHPALQFCEGVLHPAAHGAELSIALLLFRCERTSSGRPLHHTVELPLLAEPFLFFLVDVGAVFKHSRLVPIEHLVLMDTVVILGGGGEDFPDELSLRVRGDVPLVAVVAAIVLLRERSFGIPRTCVVFPLPSLRNFADGGIDALAAGDDDAMILELPFHFGEECSVPSFLYENLTEAADRRLVGNVGIGGDAEECLV